MQINESLTAVYTDILKNEKLQESCTIKNSIVDLQYSNIVNNEDRIRRHG